MKKVKAKQSPKEPKMPRIKHLRGKSFSPLPDPIDLICPPVGASKIRFVFMIKEELK